MICRNLERKQFQGKFLSKYEVSFAAFYSLSCENNYVERVKSETFQIFVLVLPVTLEYFKMQETHSISLYSWQPCCGLTATLDVKSFSELSHARHRMV